MVFSGVCAVFFHTGIKAGVVNPVSFRHHESLAPAPGKGSGDWKGIGMAGNGSVTDDAK